MRIRECVIEGYRGLKAVTWTPDALSLVEGDGALDLHRGLQLLSRASQGWSTFAEAMQAEGATEAAFWHPEAIEARWVVRVAPHEEAEMDFSYELIAERLEATPWWVVGYERADLVTDFEHTPLLERIGDRVEYFPPRKKVQGTPVTVPARSEVQRIAGDMAALGTHLTFRKDARVEAHAVSIGCWSFHRGAWAELRRERFAFGFAGLLYEDGSNLGNLLVNVFDVAETRRRFETAFRAVVPGFDTLRFPAVSDGEFAVRLVTRDGVQHPMEALPEATLRALALFGMLLSPEPPAVLWLHDAARGLDSWAVPALAGLVVEASRRFQVVLSAPGGHLERCLRDRAHAAGVAVAARAL